MSTPLFDGWTKATTAEGEQLNYGPNWITARRARLRVYPDRLECGDWVIPCRDIKGATLYSVRQAVVIPGFVLKVETTGKTYHFGLNQNGFWKGDLPFPVTREKASLGYTPSSIAFRLIALAIFVWLLWDSFAD